MRLTIIAIGGMKAGPERDLMARYAKRISALAPSIGFTRLEWRELDESRARRIDDRRAEESEATLAAVPKGAWLTLLDERGAALSSEQWAAEIGRVKDSSVSAYAVAIGGPDGFDQSLRSRARAVMSFGAMTWPHQLVRAMASEQLYRALSILAGLPYHHA